MLWKNINKKIRWITAFTAVTISCATADVGSNWIRQFGITWTFDKNISLDGSSNTYQYGTFINGDYWVVGPVNIINIIPNSTIVSGRTKNGSMININPRYCANEWTGQIYQAFDSALGDYNAALNVALNVSQSTPLLVQNGSSLLSTISLDVVPTNYYTLQTAAVLTVLGTAPAANSFRPPYCGTNKFIMSGNNLDYSYLQQLTPVASTPNLSVIEGAFERVWIDHRGGSPGRDLHPRDNMPSYGNDMAAAIGDAALMLNLNFTNQQKQKLLTRFVQYGIDLWGIYKAGGQKCLGKEQIQWIQDGGHGGGRKLPILLAGLVLQDQEMMNIGNHASNDPWFGEDQTTLYLNYAEMSKYIGNDGKYPSDNLNRDTADAYYSEADWTFTNPNGQIGIPEYSKDYPDNGRWISKRLDASYRQCCHATGFSGIVLAAHIMGIQDLWNHDALFDYLDRYVNWPNNGWKFKTYFTGSSATFDADMWNTYRASLGPIWPSTGAGPFTLTISSQNGTVSKSPNKTNYNSGETVTLTAAPNSGYSFTGWSGSTSGTTNPVTITMNGNKSVTASFAATTTSYTLTTTAVNGSITKSPNKTTYSSGETVALTATPNSGYSFTGWSGSASGTTNPISITMSSNKSVTATFTATTTSYTLTTTAVNGSITKSPNKTTYTSGETVTLSATANTGYNFSGWSGDTSGTTNPVTVTMNSNKSVTAIFAQNIAGLLTSPVTSQLTERLFSGTNDYQTISTTGWNLSGTTITLWANPNNLSGSHYILGHTIAGAWSSRIQLYLADSMLGLGLGDTHTRQTNLAAFQTGQWYFISLSWNGTNYTVQVNNQIVGTGTYTGMTAFETFADIGNNGSTADRTEPFAGMIDDVRIYSRALLNTEITSLYTYGRTAATPTTYTLSTTAANGTVTKSPNKTAYTSGETVTLTAAPNTGYTFGSWTGDSTGSANPVTITMNGNKAVTANFTQNTYTLTVTASNGTVAKSPNTATYTYGQVVTLTATPNAGYNFVSWSDGLTGSTNPATLTMNGNKSVTANYDALSLDLSMTAHWMLDENTGTTITDTGSSGRTAALINSPTWGFAWADEDWVSLESQTQAIAIPANALQPQAGAIALWVEPDSLAGTQFILGHVFNSSNRINLYSVAGKLALGLGSNIALQTNIADLTVGQPAHIVLTWNGTAYAVYVDTALKASGTFEGLTALNTTMDVGNYGDPSNRTVGFVGVVDDIRTYCREITSNEIQRLYYTYDVYQQKLVSFSIPTVYQPVSTLPTGATFASGVFSWRPWYNQVGNYTIVFTASGQPIRVVTITVHTAAMTDWYRQFLVHTEKLQ